MSSTVLLVLGTLLHTSICSAQTDSTKTYILDEIVVTATKTEAKASDQPFDVGVVTEKELHAIPFSSPNVGEAIRHLPGVNVGFGNRNIPAWVHLRGAGIFSSRTLYLVDELPLFHPMLNIATHPSNMSGVEVLLGPSSSLYGPNAAGGALNVKSKSGVNNQGVNVNMGLGSFGTTRPSVSIGKQIRNWDVYVSFAQDKSDGWKLFSLDKARYLHQALLALEKTGGTGYYSSVSIDDNSYTNNYTYGRVGYHNPEKGYGFTAGLHYMGMDYYPGAKNKTDDEKRMVGTGKLYTPISNIGFATFRFGYQEISYEGVKSTTGMISVADSLINGRFVYAEKDKNNSYVYDPTVTRSSDSKQTRVPLDFQTDWFFIPNNMLTAGLGYIKDTADQQTYGVSKNVVATTPTSDTVYDVLQSSFYLQDQYKMLNNRLVFLAGFRYDSWEYTNIYDLTSTDQHPGDITKNTNTYRAGVKYLLSKQFSVRASGGTAFYPGMASFFFKNSRSGSTWSEPNPDLKPERTKMVDAGLDYTDQARGIQASITPYIGRISDFMTYRYDQHPDSVNIQIVRRYNAGAVNIRGVELGFRQAVTREVNYYVNYTYNHSRIDDAVDDPTTKTVDERIQQGKQLANAPDHSFNFGITYDKPSLVGATLSGRYVSERFYNDEIQRRTIDYFKMDPYFVMDVKIWKNLTFSSHTVTASLGVDNLFDTDYDGEFYYTPAGRFVQFTVGYHLNM
ncbi:TonB-dependent receptor [bacterium]|nr:TonB-dependent receptor [bacterium]